VCPSLLMQLIPSSEYRVRTNPINSLKRGKYRAANRQGQPPQGKSRLLLHRMLLTSRLGFKVRDGNDHLGNLLRRLA